MGFQIPGPTKGKVNHLIATHGAERLPRPTHAFQEIPEDRALICVVDTKMYETASFHSAKGQEWDAVFVLNLVDGCIPSDMASGKPEQIDEERRLLYVAMTRAREHLHLLQPQAFYFTHQHRHGRGHVMAPRSRFLPDEVLRLFTRRTAAPNCAADAMPLRPTSPVDIGARLRDMWS